MMLNMIDSSAPPDDRAALEARDLQLINAAADRLNAEAEDVLEYQSETQTTDGTQA
jgi:hypothetical protein